MNETKLILMMILIDFHGYRLPYRSGLCLFLCTTINKRQSKKMSYRSKLFGQIIYYIFYRV